MSGPTGALRLLLPGLSGAGVVASRTAVHWLVPGGLLIGLVYVGLYRASWRIFGEVAHVRLMPALVVWLVDATLLGLALNMGAVRTIDRWAELRHGSGAADSVSPVLERTLGLVGVIALVIVLVVKFVLWTAIPEGIAGWPADWRRYLNFLYPRPVFRPLILAPMWGRWGLLLAGGIARAAPQPGGSVVGLSGGRSPAVVLGWFLVPLVITAVYCGRGGRWMIGCIIGLLVLGTTFLVAVMAARRFAGHTRFTIYAAAFVAEVTFLACYLAAAQRIY